MEKIWEIFPDLTEVIKRNHEESDAQNGHNFFHAIQVCHMATRLTEDPQTGKLAGVAGLCHNADHVITRLKKLGMWEGAENEEKDIRHLVREWLCQEPRLSREEHEIIIEAVVRHNRPNEGDDDEVTIALKDADRIVCLALEVIIRSGQFHPELPTISGTQGTYKEPKSVAEDLGYCLEWVDPEKPRFCVRLAKSWPIALERAGLLKLVLDKMSEQAKEPGYPF